MTRHTVVWDLEGKVGAGEAFVERVTGWLSLNGRSSPRQRRSYVACWVRLCSNRLGGPIARC
jgi:hypothetical protein